MLPRALRLAWVLLSAGLAFAATGGCAMVHGWAQASTDHAPRAGASVSVPFGR